MSGPANCLVTCIVTSDNKCIITSDNKYVIIGETVEVTGGAGDSEVFQREVSRDWYWHIKGFKIVPLFLDYNIIFQLLVELVSELFGLKTQEQIKSFNIKGNKALLRTLISKIIGEKGYLSLYEINSTGQKLKDYIIDVKLRGTKEKEDKFNLEVSGEKTTITEVNTLFTGQKLNSEEIYKSLVGIKNKLEQSTTPVSGEKINELVKEHFFQGQIDLRGLLYLLFDEEGLENATLIDKLSKEDYFILFDEESEEL